MGKKVLFVDDDELILGFFESFLRRVKLDPLKAANGQDAIDTYKQNQPDLVFLDISLPDKDGLEVLKEIKALNPEAKVIMLSGKIDPASFQKAKDLGAFDFISKPVTFDMLKEKIAKIFG